MTASADNELPVVDPAFVTPLWWRYATNTQRTHNKFYSVGVEMNGDGTCTETRRWGPRPYSPAEVRTKVIQHRNFDAARASASQQFIKKLREGYVERDEWAS